METIPVPVLLKHRIDSIREPCIAGHGEELSAGLWKEKVPCSEVEELVTKFPEKITRGDLFRLGDAARRDDADARRRLLFGTLMWGYGRVGGRSYLNANRVRKSVNLDHKLEECTVAVTSGDLRAAYGSLKGLPGFGEPYFTKYLYFLAHNVPLGCNDPKPLIFDSRVRKSLGFISHACNAAWTAPFETSRPGKHPSPSDLYLLYCHTMHRWAKDLGLESDVLGAERIEYFLYGRSGEFDCCVVIRRLVTAIIDDIGDRTVGKRTEAIVDYLGLRP